MKLRYSARTDVGKKREINEDSYGPPESPAEHMAGQLMVVCDGMGGHASGEVASSIGVETILHTYYASAEQDRAAALRFAFEHANHQIFIHGRGTMGTTGVAALIYRDTLYIANVGDSRAYVVHGDTLRQISLDHSYVAEQVQAGILTPEQARTSLVRNIITRALGHQPDVDVDLFTVPLSVGDVVILTSDGMYGLVEDDEIAEAIAHLPPDQATSALINLANKRGGGDNITVIVAQVEQMDAPRVDAAEQRAGSVADDTPTDKLDAAHPQPAMGTHAAAQPTTNAPPPVERPATRLGVLLAGALLVLLIGVTTVALGVFNGARSDVTSPGPTTVASQPPATAQPSATIQPSPQPTANNTLSTAAAITPTTTQPQPTGTPSPVRPSSAPTSTP